MIPAPVEAAKNTKSAAAESKLKIKGVFRSFAESPFFVFHVWYEFWSTKSGETAYDTVVMKGRVTYEDIENAQMADDFIGSSLYFTGNCGIGHSGSNAKNVRVSHWYCSHCRRSDLHDLLSAAGRQ